MELYLVRLVINVSLNNRFYSSSILVRPSIKTINEAVAKIATQTIKEQI